MIRLLIRPLICAAALLTALTPSRADEPAPRPRPRIEVAILLDTSGSMEGLINQARARLWAIVNSLVTTEKNGQIPDLRVALYEYGNDGLPAEEGFVRTVVPLTDDLDRISQELFALTTNGGSEFCGLAIQRATRELQWSDGDHYKAVFIAGNEPFTQGPIDYVRACGDAIGKGIVVNTIHCGAEHEGREGKWVHGAQLADGRSINIDANAAVAAIAAPQDARIEELGLLLNDTYLAYGAAGAQNKARQEAVDQQSQAAAPGALAERAFCKANAQYRNGDWDLVDACNDNPAILLELPEDQWPEALRKMTPAERKALVEAKAAARKAIQDEINKLAAQRAQYLAGEQKKLAEQGVETFDSAVKNALGEQLEKRGYIAK